ncbi:unnamed protein product [Lupinus luteus]|uniref:Uncharacterized protein n=1 Tax=Lupinus luteus TaxID=3873 RepID=A0AAV1W843_LUPLU
MTTNNKPWNPSTTPSSHHNFLTVASTFSKVLCSKFQEQGSMLQVPGGTMQRKHRNGFCFTGSTTIDQNSTGLGSHYNAAS